MKTILISLACLFTVLNLNAQLKIGLRTNVFTSFDEEQSVTLQNIAPLEIIDFKYVNSNMGYSVGGFVYGSNKLLFFMTEFLFQKNTSNFNLSSDENNLQRANSSRDFSLKRESIYIPVAAGLKLGRLKIGLGPTFNFVVNQENNIEDLESFQVNRDPFETGFQFIVGYNLFDKIHIDLKREVSFSNVTDGINYHDQAIGLKKSISKTSLSFGILF